MVRWIPPAAAVAAFVAAWPTSADAQTPDIEVPALILDGETDEERSAALSDLDLDNVVQTAAKGVTTVQEAPAIVTVITDQAIAESGATRLDDVLDTVPGWLRHDAIHNQFPFGLTRGALQAMLLMHEGVSLFDPWTNVPTVGRLVPLETIKRVEIITGPGGVLWGANSYLGIVNMISKDAEDVDGVEADIRVGDGPGDRGVLRGYVMAGIPEVLHEDVSVMLHASFHSYDGPTFSMPQHLFSTPLPQPNSVMIYGPLTQSDAQRSTLIQLNGNARLGPIRVLFHMPFVAERNMPLGFPGAVIQQAHPEDRLVDRVTGELACEELSMYMPDGSRNPLAGNSTDQCVDRARIARNHGNSFSERYAIAEYQTRSESGQMGVTVKAYLIEFDRSYQQLAILAPSTLLEGGLSFKFDSRAYRTGVSLDGDIELSNQGRVLYGAEVFREWIPDNVTQSRQGAGRQAEVIGPYDLSRLALPCPREPVPNAPGQTRHVGDCPLTMVFETDRTVAGAYLNPQWRYRRLILDAGLRVQAAPAALAEASYDAQIIAGGAAVVEFARNWHAKASYTEGFRPPVFNNTNSNGNAIQLDGSTDLGVETSQAIQAEVNARLFKGKRQLDEVNFRADYSYTTLDNLIQIQQGRYANLGRRGIHSAEFLGKIHLRGGHHVSLGYTWLKVASEDRGYLRMLPEHWFNLGGVFNVVPRHLQVSTNIKILGAMEDANRLVEHRPLEPDPMTGVLTDASQLSVEPHELVLDRLPPAAVLTAGATWWNSFGVRGVTTRAYVYNAFNARHYNPDGFGDYEPRLELLPNPYPDLRFVLDANFRY